ncbi:Hypothetical protein NTJ_01694 [Nesidiocoris tenuis]|uniref:Uncharacterized protein n=1 Tax=Nesidiocoris tenuis TaxID=355587 RepID=A0ABN7A994_9HEMI|nr:Hypothetical protein NTJ_01694 [Nesidiocoris tenuis]
MVSGPDRGIALFTSFAINIGGGYIGGRQIGRSITPLPVKGSTAAFRLCRSSARSTLDTAHGYIDIRAPPPLCTLHPGKPMSKIRPGNIDKSQSQF